MLRRKVHIPRRKGIHQPHMTLFEHGKIPVQNIVERVLFEEGERGAMRAPRIEDACGQLHGAPPREVNEHDARVEVVRPPHADALCLACAVALTGSGERCRAEVVRVETGEPPDAECIGIEIEDPRQLLRYQLRHENPSEYAAVDPLMRNPIGKWKGIECRACVIDMDIRPRKGRAECLQPHDVRLRNPVADKMKANLLPRILRGNRGHDDARVFYIACVYTKRNFIGHLFPPLY